MTYELVKKLKNAGFPQNNGIAIVSDGTKFEIEKTDILMKDMCYVPTLSELIEACGGKLSSLDCVPIINTSAKSNDIKGGYEAVLVGEQFFTWGSTPEEAVALLWLELNK